MEAQILALEGNAATISTNSSGGFVQDVLSLVDIIKHGSSSAIFGNWNAM